MITFFVLSKGSGRFGHGENKRFLGSKANNHNEKFRLPRRRKYLITPVWKSSSARTRSTRGKICPNWYVVEVFM